MGLENMSYHQPDSKGHLSLQAMGLDKTQKTCSWLKTRQRKRKLKSNENLRFQSWGLSCFPLDFPCMRASVVSNSKYSGIKFREICPKLDKSGQN